jgi:hypothetical protein
MDGCGDVSPGFFASRIGFKRRFPSRRLRHYKKAKVGAIFRCYSSILNMHLFSLSFHRYCIASRVGTERDALAATSFGSPKAMHISPLQDSSLIIMRWLRFGDDCLPLSWRPLEKASEQESKAERRGDARPVGEEVSIFRRDSVDAELREKQGRLGRGSQPAFLSI